jgi:hypothetical protein
MKPGFELSALFRKDFKSGPRAYLPSWLSAYRA